MMALESRAAITSSQNNLQITYEMLIKIYLILPGAKITKSPNPPNNDFTMIYHKEKQQMIFLLYDFCSVVLHEQ